MSRSIVKVHEVGDQDFSVHAALLLYRSSTGSVYATAHDVHPVSKNQPAMTLGPGRAATKAALAEFAGAVTDAVAFRGMIPANLLYTAPNIVAWWSPAQVRRVWFRCADGIGEASAEVIHPPLVFVAAGSGWYVFALNVNVRPDADTPLFKAPYYNVWDDGQICVGNTTLPHARGPEAISAYEDAFFRSRFTHSNDKKLVAYKGGAAALWRDQLQHPDQLLLNDKILIARKESLKQAIQRIAPKATK